MSVKFYHGKKNQTDPGPPKCGAYRERKDILPTMFKKFYERGDFPVAVDSDVRGCKLKWKVEIETLDLHHFLPLFFDGLRLREQPMATIARQGVKDLLLHTPHKVYPVVSQCIMPIKLALETRHHDTMVATIKGIMLLAQADELSGQALVPYYRQILPILNLFKGKNVNTGDRIDYSQQKNENLGDLIEDTLQLLERHGGEDAFINIKYMVPTYESCLYNK